MRKETRAGLPARADVAITTTFGPDTLTGLRVWTDEIAGPRVRATQSAIVAELLGISRNESAHGIV